MISNEPVNQVDVSGTTIKAEWESIAEAIKYSDPVEDEPKSGVSDTGAIEGDFIESKEVKKEYKDFTPEEIAEKEGSMTAVLEAGGVMAFAFLKIDYVDKKYLTDFCEKWAVVIVKRWPANPVGKFHEEYKDIIAAGMSSLILIGAIRSGRKVPDKVESTVKGSFEGVENDNAA